MSRVITATGMALLSIGIVAPVQAQPVSSAGQVALDTAATPVATEAARRKGPKIKEKTATDTSRVANPPTTGAPAADAPIPAPEAVRTGRPKIKVKTPTNDRVTNPAPATEPVATPETARTGRPKVRDKTPMDTSRTGGRPKERDDDARDTSRTGGTSVTTPKRGTNLLLPALGGAAAIAAIVVTTSGNDKPSSP